MSAQEFIYDYLIVGAGPAGLQLGYFLGKSGRSYCILERDHSPGSFFRTYPRHRTLISNNKVFTGFNDDELNLRWDWNSLLCDEPDLRFRKYSKAYFPPADSLVSYLTEFSDRHRLNIRFGVTIKSISREGTFLVTDDEGHIYKASKLIIATGASKPFVPPIAGIGAAEQYSNMSIDPTDFSDQRVLIIGKGNSGFETAQNLMETAATIHIVSPHPVKMAWQSHHVGHVRAVNNDFLDSYQLKCQNAVLDAEVESLEKVGQRIRVCLSYAHAHGERESLIYDRVISCTGFRFDDSIFDPNCRPSLTCGGRFPEQTAEWQSTSVPDLYFAGTLMQARDYKRTNSGFIHGFRYNTRCLIRMLEEKYHGVSWPRRFIPQASDALSRAILDRVNRSSALWQQFGFLSDICQLSWTSGEGAYYEEMPVDYAKERFAAEPYLSITLEFGHTEGYPFSTLRHPDPRLAERSTFLHPVIRYFVNSEMVSEHHILEDLAGEWRKEQVHASPLRAFLDSVAMEPA